MSFTEMIVALVAAIAAEEILGLTVPVSRWLVKRNARRLPPGVRDSYEEEWLRHLEEVHGSVAKLIFSLDLYRATHFIQRESRRAAGPRSRDAARPESLKQADEAVIVAEPAGQTLLGTLPDVGLLTLRQLEVLARMCRGKTNKEVADELGLAEKTIKAHVTAIFKALGVVNRAQAVLVARRVGMMTDAAAPIEVPETVCRPRETFNVGLLTLRQLEVLSRMCQGKSNRQIAAELGITARTVRVHVGAICGTLGVADRAQAVVAARRQGMMIFGAGDSRRGRRASQIIR